MPILTQNICPFNHYVILKNITHFIFTLVGSGMWKWCELFKHIDRVITRNLLNSHNYAMYAYLYDHWYYETLYIIWHAFSAMQLSGYKWCTMARAYFNCTVYNLTPISLLLNSITITSWWYNLYINYKNT